MKRSRKTVMSVLIGIVLVCCIAVCPSCTVLDDLPKHTNFVPVEDSKRMTGIFKMFDKEIKLPCTVADLVSQGFETDYKVFSDTISMWPADNKTVKFFAYPDTKIKYERDEIINEDALIVAIKFDSEDGIDFDFNDVKFEMTGEEFVKSYGKPAYERDYGPQGYGRYYEGDNGCVYRFMFRSENKLWTIMIATPEFIEWEINYLYH